MRWRFTAAGLRTAFTDLILAAVYALFAFAHLHSFLQHPRASVLLMVPFEAVLAFFFVARRPAGETQRSPQAWISTMVGTFGALLLRPSADASDLLAWEAVQATGLALALAGLLSLNRSIGLLPANRGIRRSGAYRIVRHPLYGAYTVIHVGYVANNFTVRNVTIAGIVLAAQLVRIQGEELLLSRDPEYVAYRQQTRWRLVPFVY